MRCNNVSILRRTIHFWIRKCAMCITQLHSLFYFEHILFSTIYLCLLRSNRFHLILLLFYTHAQCSLLTTHPKMSVLCLVHEHTSLLVICKNIWKQQQTELFWLCSSRVRTGLRMFCHTNGVNKPKLIHNMEANPKSTVVSVLAY